MFGITVQAERVCVLMVTTGAIGGGGWAMGWW